MFYANKLEIAINVLLILIYQLMDNVYNVLMLELLIALDVIKLDGVMIV